MSKNIFRSNFITLILSDYVPEAQDVPEWPREHQERPAQAFEAEH